MASMFVVALVFFDKKERVKHQVPVCMSIQYQGKPCIMCGSTSAFYEISKGHWNRALESNKIAVILYLFIWINLFIFIGYTFRR